ncbi:MAG: hypothetical protein ACUVSQ_01870 [Pseudanabaenaceae cyanobacterium]
MLANLVDWVGDRNPQLLREWKGRWQPRAVVIALALAVLAQGLFLLAWWSQLPDTETVVVGQRYHPYCLTTAASTHKACLLDSNNRLMVDWERWYLDIFRSLNWLLPLSWWVPSVLFLAADMQREESRGTATFLRLSPQPPAAILTGKLWGVPSLCGLMLASAVPLHLWLAHQVAADPGFVFGYYLLLAAGTRLLFPLTLLLAAIAGHQQQRSDVFGGLTLVLAGGVGFGFSLVFWLGNLAIAWEGPDSHYLTQATHFPVYWFGYRLNGGRWVSYTFTLANLLWLARWAWVGLQRRFADPQTPVFRKSQAYLLLGYWYILGLGFVWEEHGSWHPEALQVWHFLILIANLAAIAVLSPHRQTLLDWARHRHQTRRSVWQDLFLAENSPAPPAIALAQLGLLGITAIALLFPNRLMVPERLSVFATTLLLGLWSILLAVVGQRCLLLKTQKRVLWAGGTLASLVILPPLILAIAGIHPDQIPSLWLGTAFPSATLGSHSLTLRPWLGVTTLASLSSILLYQKHRQYLHHLGTSEWQQRQSSIPAADLDRE